MSKTPHRWQMELTDCIASYMKARFQEEAYHHPINIGKNWGGKTCNAEAAERYTEVTEPSILVTDSNTICIWYLPDALSPKRRANIWNCLHLLREPLWESIKASPQAWQMDKSYFCDNAELKGTINLSPAWFQQGHGVAPKWLPGSLMAAQIQDRKHFYKGMDGREALIHLGKQVEQRVDSDMSSILLIWSSTYSSMSVMVNQATCYCRDINGWDPWYDMLVTVGNYLPLDFVIPTLNLQLCYNPGTIIAFSGSALEHGVGVVDGDRACLAYYMHANDMLALEFWMGGVAKILQMGGCFDIIDWAGTQS
ncbi:hypothetical protein F5J12DRAFT_783694 [Pisolithus orientalis]|uniref:uncharacterized protein n=1 Tax=Pisolithus orientalis TaxID=936130 RepID=UPI002225A28E|nr:uncharacterized protein F5J12DRAFT_783694 [Pisolithus orientalis]KAI6003268.1 hypothetical protein F5J12DRAFT_783694 [Pisolithus orientalis]